MPGAGSSAAGGRLHDAGTAAGRNDVVALVADRREGAAALGCNAAEAPRLVVPARHAGRPRRAASGPFACLMRALPKTTMVVRTPHARHRSSALANSRRKRTPCMESLRMKSRYDAGAIGGRKLLKLV